MLLYIYQQSVKSDKLLVDQVIRIQMSRAKTTNQKLNLVKIKYRTSLSIFSIFSLCF